MKEMIEQLVDIDNKSKDIVGKCEEKKDNIETYITIELEKRKNDINAKYKYKINFLKDEYKKDLFDKQKQIKENSQKIIEELQNNYNNKKNVMIEEILKEVLK